jgi:protein-histidine pros-kinase
LQRLLGDSELAEVVAQSFLADTPRQIQALKAAVGCGDSALAGKLAHRIKGASQAVAGTAMQQLTHAMECAGRSADLNGLRQLLPQVDTEFERLRQPLESKAWRTD